MTREDLQKRLDEFMDAAFREYDEVQERKALATPAPESPAQVAYGERMNLPEWSRRSWQEDCTAMFRSGVRWAIGEVARTFDHPGLTKEKLKSIKQHGTT